MAPPASEQLTALRKYKTVSNHDKFLTQLQLHSWSPRLPHSLSWPTLKGTSQLQCQDKSRADHRMKEGK